MKKMLRTGQFLLALLELLAAGNKGRNNLREVWGEFFAEDASHDAEEKEARAALRAL